MKNWCFGIVWRVIHHPKVSKINFEVNYFRFILTVICSWVSFRCPVSLQVAARHTGASILSSRPQALKPAESCSWCQWDVFRGVCVILSCTFGFLASFLSPCAYLMSLPSFFGLSRGRNKHFKVLFHVVFCSTPPVIHSISSLCI